MRRTSWTWGSSQAMTAGSFHRACVLPTYRDVSWFRAGDWLWEMAVTHSTLLLLLLLLTGWQGLSSALAFGVGTREDSQTSAWMLPSTSTTTSASIYF